MVKMENIRIENKRYPNPNVIQHTIYNIFKEFGATCPPVDTDRTHILMEYPPVVTGRTHILMVYPQVVTDRTHILMVYPPVVTDRTHIS